jgi:hypothetical protein
LKGIIGTPAGGKLPARGLYDGDRIAAFDHFHLRRDTELNALKLYFSFVAMRNNALNAARFGYDKMREYTGIRQNKITAAVSFLTSLGLVYVETGSSSPGERPTAHAYRLVDLDPYRHAGTTRRGDAGEIDDLERYGWHALVYRLTHRFTIISCVEWRPAQGCASAIDLEDDVMGGLGPDKGLGVGVVVRNVVADGGGELGHTFEDTATNTLGVIFPNSVQQD